MPNFFISTKFFIGIIFFCISEAEQMRKSSIFNLIIDDSSDCLLSVYVKVLLKFLVNAGQTEHRKQAF